jgi:hypothetical protein
MEETFMKKLLTFIGIFSLLLVLSACSETSSQQVTAPSFVGIQIDGENPQDGSGLVPFYKEKNEPTLVRVELDNPSNVEIRYITISGYSYARTKFLEGFTEEVIEFYLDPGATIGSRTYSVDDIEYFDGTNTRDVVVESTNNQFVINVFKDAPIVLRENYSLSQEDISIDFTITDVDSVIDDGSLYVELYRGENLITDEQVSPGFVNINFDGLLSDTLYEIKVRADYDLEDNTGAKSEIILFNGTFTTLSKSLPSAVIENLEIGSNQVTFDVVYTDEDEVTADGGLKVQLFQGDNFVREASINGSIEGIVFDELFNSTDYSVRVVSDYDLDNGGGISTNQVVASNSFTTLSRALPEPIIDNVQVETNRILFDVIIEDDEEQPIIDISTLVAKVYVEGVLARTVIIENETVDIQIYDILAGKDVYIELVADYDLNDGNGLQEDQVIHVIEFESLLNEAPQVFVSEVTVTQGYILVDLLVSDFNNTLNGSIVATLYEDEVEIGQAIIDVNDTSFYFTHLVQYTKNYRIEIVADYNLRDGEGNKEDVLLYVHALTSLVPKPPAAELQNIVTTTDQITFDVEVKDADETIEDNTTFVQILKDGVVIHQEALVIGANTINYNGLLSNNEYQIIVISDFNVLDGSGIQTEKELVNALVTTQAKVAPTASITGEETTIDSVEFDVSVTDLDNVIEAGSLVAILYQNGLAIGSPVSLTVGDNYDISFTGIMSDSEFVLKVIADYNLDDNAGITSAAILAEASSRTDIKQEPSASLQNIEELIETITFDVIVTDLDDVIVDNTLVAALYVGDTPTGHSVDLSVGLNAGVTFNNVFSNQDFNIRIETDYDLNDGITYVEDALLAYDFATTGINQMITGDIYAVSEGIDSLTFNAVITDYDTV